MKKLAYLAPQVTALSTTFVYKEILGLEARGYQILPVSVHPDEVSAAEVAELRKRTDSLYSHSVISFITTFFSALIFTPVRTITVLGLYLQDVITLGAPGIQQLKLGYQMLVGIWLAKKLRNAGVEHLHIHFGDVPAQIGMYAARHAGIPFSVMIHANDLFEHGRLLKQKAERACAVATISEFNKNLLQDLQIDPAKIHIVRCGIDPEEFPYSEPTKNQSTATAGLVARLVEKKGIDTLIQAVATLKEKNINVQVKIAGTGPDLEDLEKLSRDLDVEDNIRFVGKIANSAIGEWMKSLDLFVLPAKKDSNGDMDGIPVSLMESMALGVPVVSTRLSGIPELIIDQETGVLVDPGDYIKLAEEMQKLIASSTLRIELSRGARKMIETEFSQSLNLDRLENIFNEKCTGK